MEGTEIVFREEPGAEESIERRRESPLTRLGVFV